MKKALNFETESEILEEATAIFNTLIKTLDEEPSFEKYKFGIVKMFDFFKDEYDKNVKLLTTCQEMNAQIVINATKISLIQKSAFSDAESLQKMKQDFDDAANMVQSVHKSEIRSKELLKNLKIQVKALNDQIQSGDSFSFGSNQSVYEASNEVKNVKKELQKAIDECNDLNHQIQTMNNELEQTNEKNKILNNEFSKLTKNISQIDKRISIINKENEETTKTIINMKPEISEMKDKIVDLQKNKVTKQNNNQKVKNSSIELFSAFNAAKDETRHLKDKIIRKQIKLADISHKISVNQQNFESKTDQLKNDENSLIDAKSQLENESKKLIDNNKTLEEEFNNNEKIIEEKNKVRLKLKKLLQEISSEVTKINENEGVQSYDNRQIDSTKEQLTVLKMNQHGIAHELNEIKNSQNVLKSEIINKKSYLQAQKDKIIRIIKEIDSTRSLFFKTNADILCINDANQVMVEENEKLLKEHSNLTRKLEMQLNMSDQTREERNAYAGQLKSKEEENKALQSSINDLTSLISSSKQQNEKLFNSTIDAHFKIRNDNDIIDSMNLEINEIKNNTHRVERLTSHLQAENQTLNYIINEASTDHTIINEERQMLIKTIGSMNEQLSQKKMQSDEISSKITNLNKLVESNRASYDDKIKEIETLYKELESRTKTTKILEKKVEHFDQLNYQMQKITSSLVYEKRKYIVLVHEFSVPRNVHRWELIQSVDPLYVKNIRFRMQLSERLKNIAYEIEHLKNERDSLKKRISEMNVHLESGMTKEQVLKHIETYKNDIKQKDEDMKEMERIIKETINPLRKTNDSVLSMRVKVNNRRESACSIKNEIYATSRSVDSMFLTEGKTATLVPPRPLIMGGGFNVIITPKMQRRCVHSSNILKVGQSPVITRNTTRMETRHTSDDRFNMPSIKSLL